MDILPQGSFTELYNTLGPDSSICSKNLPESVHICQESSRHGDSGDDNER